MTVRKLVMCCDHGVLVCPYLFRFKHQEWQRHCCDRPLQIRFRCCALQFVLLQFFAVFLASEAIMCFVRACFFRQWLIMIIMYLKKVILQTLQALSLQPMSIPYAFILTQTARQRKCLMTFASKQSQCSVNRDIGGSCCSMFTRSRR